jgi:prevent-host-death family protein
MKTMTASKAKNNFGYLLEEVYMKGKSITITKNSRPIAKVSPIYSYEDIKIEPTLSLNDKEYKKVKEQMDKFKDTFKFSF